MGKRLEEYSNIKITRFKKVEVLDPKKGHGMEADGFHGMDEEKQDFYGKEFVGGIFKADEINEASRKGEFIAKDGGGIRVTHHDKKDN